MNKTKIEWVKNPDGSPGYSWNPITGCLNGCDYCYARKLANTRLRERYLANKDVAPYKDERDYMDNRHNPFYPRFWEDRIGKPDRWSFDSKAHGVFVCDMSDLFGIGIPEEWTRRVLGVIEEQLMRPEKDRFYLLTKQPQNLIKFSPFPDNCWVGVTATNRMAYSAAITILGSIQAKVKYLSLEPLLESLLLFDGELKRQGIKWVIIGSQTKPTVMPKIEWVQEIALACTKAHIPLFLKDSLKSLLPNRMPFWAGVSWKEMSCGVPITMSENRFRQEFPK